MAVQRRGKPYAGIPLRLVLTVPFVLHVVFVAGLVGLLSFRNGQRAVDSVTRELRDEIGARIEERLLSFLDTPRHINQVNEAALRRGRLDAHDPSALEGHFWDQVRAFGAVSSIYFGNTAGGLVDSGREGPDGDLYVIATDGFARGTFRKYTTDDEGNRTDLIATVPDFDARTRPWYSNAVASGGAAWSDVYVLFTGQDLALAASRPVYDEQQRLLGVVSVDLFLAQLSDFLGHLKIGKTGHSFVIERSGLLIASSTNEKPFTAPDEHGASRRLAADESTVPLIRGAFDALNKRFGSCRAITDREQLMSEIGGERQFLQVLPVSSDYGADWLVVTVIPETDFMAQISANNRTTGLLIFAALVLAGLLGVVAARWLTRPILHLNASAQALAKGDWLEMKDGVNGIAEVRELELSFAQMVGELQRMLRDLNTEADERKRAMTSLQESEERLGLVLAGAELGTWDWNVQTGDVVFNERWAGMLGYSLDEINPHVSSWREFMHPDETAAVMAALTDHLEGRTPSYQTEHRLRAKSGEWIWVLDTGKVFARDAEGRPLRAAGTHQDITLRKRMAEQLVHQERLAAVGQLASGVAHDFNNILASIMGFTELLRTSPDTPESMRSDLAEINVSSQRGAHLVSQILDFCQKSLRQPQRIDLSVSVKRCVEDLSPPLPKTIRLRLKGFPSGCLVEVDTAQLQQIVANLVSNARDAMSGGGELQIELSRVQGTANMHCAACRLTITGEWWRLGVTDTGIGICAETLPRVFDPFFTTKDVGKGAGLGLSQVAGIMAQHGGHVTAESTPGRGTTVACYFPPLGVDESHLAPVRAVESGPRELVLLVGDDLPEVEATAAMLGRLGYGTLMASNGQEAIGISDTHGDDIALVLSDAAVLDMDGETLLDQLRSRSHGLKIVVMSDVPREDRGAELLELGVVGWIQKPFTFSALSRELAEIAPRTSGRWD